jgi:hypothetical protein
MESSDGSPEDQNATRNVDNSDCSNEVSDNIRMPLRIGLEAICVIFWQRTC